MKGDDATTYATKRLTKMFGEKRLLRAEEVGEALIESLRRDEVRDR